MFTVSLGIIGWVADLSGSEAKIERIQGDFILRCGLLIVMLIPTAAHSSGANEAASVRMSMRFKGGATQGPHSRNYLARTLARPVISPQTRVDLWVQLLFFRSYIKGVAIARMQEARFPNSQFLILLPVYNRRSCIPWTFSVRCVSGL